MIYCRLFRFYVSNFSEDKFGSISSPSNHYFNNAPLLSTGEGKVIFGASPTVLLVDNDEIQAAVLKNVTQKIELNLQVTGNWVKNDQNWRFLFCFPSCYLSSYLYGFGELKFGFSTSKNIRDVWQIKWKNFFGRCIAIRVKKLTGFGKSFEF